MQLSGSGNALRHPPTCKAKMLVHDSPLAQSHKRLAVALSSFRPSAGFGLSSSAFASDGGIFFTHETFASKIRARFWDPGFTLVCLSYYVSWIFHLHTATKGTLPLGAACKQMYATANDVNDRKDVLLINQQFLQNCVLEEENWTPKYQKCQLFFITGFLYRIQHT